MQTLQQALPSVSSLLAATVKHKSAAFLCEWFVTNVVLICFSCTSYVSHGSQSPKSTSSGSVFFLSSLRRRAWSTLIFFWGVGDGSLCAVSDQYLSDNANRGVSWTYYWSCSHNHQGCKSSIYFPWRKGEFWIIYKTFWHHQQQDDRP